MRIASVAGIAVVAGIVVAVADPADRDPKPRERVGVYDSRAVAVAFAGSEPFGKWMAPLTAEMEKAKAAGDKKRIAEVESEGASRQKTMHMQAFSTASVDNILEMIKDLLPGIREKAGVSALVSKWDKDAMARYAAAEQVDVTVALVDAFKPSERQRKSAMLVTKKDPIPLDQAARAR